MTIIDTWISELSAGKISVNPQPLESTVETAIEALAAIQTAFNPPGPQPAHTFLGGPTGGGPANPTFRLLDQSDLAAITTFTAGLIPFGSATGGLTTDALFSYSSAGHLVSLQAQGGGTPVYFVQAAGGPAPVLLGQSSRGTLAVPTPTLTGDALLNITTRGRGATAFSGNNATHLFVATENWTDAAQGSNQQFFVTPNGTNAAILATTIGATGQAVSISANGFVGVQVTNANAGNGASAGYTASNGASFLNLSILGAAALATGPLVAGDVGLNVLNSAAINATNGNIYFTNGAGLVERARINTAGSLLVGGTTSPFAGTQANVFNGSTNNGIVINDTNAVAGTDQAMIFARAGLSVGAITTTLAGTTYAVVSDMNLKDNILPAPDAGAVIDAIQVRAFDYKMDGSHRDFGLVAQELNPHFPHAVVEGRKDRPIMEDGTEGDEIEIPWMIDHSKLVPLLLKEIQSLRARVAALDGKT